MQDKFEALIAAILADDLIRVMGLTDDDRGLVRREVEEDRYHVEITHWIYAGDTGLHVAAAGHKVTAAVALLAADADVAAAGNRRRSQPLHYAADGHADSPSWNPKDQVMMIRALLKSEADINAQDKNGATPLHRAVRTRCAAAVVCLLDEGADATIRNHAGSTPFHLAVQNTGRGGSGSKTAREAQREIIRAFMEWEVSPRLMDARGRSVLDWAKSDWIRRMLEGNAA